MTSEFWCIACGEFGGLDVLNNIVMFVPLGFAFALATNRPMRSILACVAVTLFVESMQVRVVTGRDASLSDLLANSLGGVIGVGLARWRQTLFQPRGRAASALAVAGAALFASVTSLTSLGFRPAAVPRSLWVQWAPERATFLPFTGQLLDFRLDSIELPRRFYPPTSLGVDRVLRGREWRATATIGTVNMQPTHSVVARIAEEFTVIVSIEQFGWDLACQQKTRSSDFRFRSAKIVLQDVLSSSTPAAPLRVRFTCSRAGPTLVGATDDRQDVLRLSPSLGWLMLSPFNIAITSGYAWLGALWLIALAFPAGYWIRFVGDTRGVPGSPGGSTVGRVGALTAIAAAMVLGLLVVPLLAETAPASWWEWTSAVLGVATGALSAQVASRWESRWRLPTSRSAVTPVSDTPR